jgi:hypothetical protein
VPRLRSAFRHVRQRTARPQREAYSSHHGRCTNALSTETGAAVSDQM